MAVLNRPLLHPPAGAALARLRRPSGLLIAALAAVAVAALAQVVQSSDATTRGYEIQQLQRRQLELQAGVHQKEAEVAALASLDRIEREARTKLGMVPPQRRLDLQVSEPVPQEQLLPTRFLPPPSEPPPAPAGRPWWRRILDRLPL